MFWHSLSGKGLKNIFIFKDELLCDSELSVTDKIFPLNAKDKKTITANLSLIFGFGKTCQHNVLFNYKAVRPQNSNLFDC